jgi:hypothetical protein
VLIAVRPKSDTVICIWEHLSDCRSDVGVYVLIGYCLHTEMVCEIPVLLLPFYIEKYLEKIVHIYFRDVSPYKIIITGNNESRLLTHF